MLCVIVEYILWRKRVKLGLDWGVGSSRRIQAILQERSCIEARHHPLLGLEIKSVYLTNIFSLTHLTACVVLLLRLCSTRVPYLDEVLNLLLP